MQGVQLITYPDSLGGDLAAIAELLGDELAGLFPGGVHILPPFPSSGDRGFAPIDYDRIDPAFGDWADIEAIAAQAPVTLDLMVNHVSRHSEIFQDFVQHGRASTWADAFITLDKVWPGGEPDPADVAKIFLRKPEHPFSDIVVADTGEVERIWTSFGPRVDWSEQIDLDVTSPVARQLFDRWFARFAAHGVKTVRLDAVGYVTKERGTRCFMVEPRIWEELDRFAAQAGAHGLTILPEIHDVPATFDAVAAAGHTGYDFVFPGMILEALLSGDGAALADRLARATPRAVTMLDCHDGIPVQPDLVGALPEERLRAMVDSCVARGANLNRILSAEPGSFDAHQINMTYRSACGDDERYLSARAIQLFTPGIPQVYYVGLLGGLDDHQAVIDQGEGRAVNRHDYTRAEITEALATDLVARQLELIRLRNEHPAFGGTHEVAHDGHDLRVRWTAGEARCELVVDLAAGTHVVTAT